MEDKNDYFSRLNSIKNFSGRVAHDFNNILTGILGFTQLILMDMGEDNKHYSDMRQIEKAAKKGRAFTDQLLIFSQKKPLEKEDADINKIIESVVREVEDSLKPDVVIKTDLNEVPTLSLDRDRMNQALKGIVMNSTDAIEDKGEISLSTGVAEDGKHVLVSVSDNGKGANQEDLPNIFEPFYRTKMARISGASLTTAYAIVKEHDGNIDALIRDEGGLIFKIGLPV